MLVCHIYLWSDKAYISVNTDFTVELTQIDYSGHEGETVNVRVRVQGVIENEIEVELLLLTSESDLEQHNIDLNIIDFAERKYT